MDTTTSKIFICGWLLTVLVMSSQITLGQRSWALKPYSITMPRVNETDQNEPTKVPQTSGSTVYNTERRTIAVYDGGQWQYLAQLSDLPTVPDIAQFPNFRAFYSSGGQQTWTIPAGVTRLIVEAWGAGAGGGIYNAGTQLCSGGGQSGSYVRKSVNNLSGITSIIVRPGGGGAGSGDGSLIYLNTTASLVIAASGGGGSGSFDTNSSWGPPGLIVPSTGNSPIMASYAQKDASNYVLTLKLSDGGTGYGATPGSMGLGTSVVLQNNTTKLFGVDTSSRQGSFPGGGGGCGYVEGGGGGNGLIIIHW